MAKTENVQRWDSAAVGWLKWWPTIEAGAEPLCERMLALAELGPGHRVLDLASGIGEPAVSAARVVGPEGRVLATDISTGMIELGQKRIEALGLTNLDFRHMDAEAPHQDVGRFDVILCRWGLMFVQDLPACLEQLRALLVPGGRLSIAVWAAPEQCPALSLSGQVIDAEIGLPPAGPEERTPFHLSDRTALEADLAAAGFTAITGEAVPVVYHFESPDHFVTFRREVATLDQKLTHHPAERVEAAWRAVGRAVESYRTPEGIVRLENSSICLAARNPG